MQQTQALSFYSLLLLVALIACNDPSPIGADLLESDLIGSQFKDDFEIKAQTTYGEPVKVEDSLLIRRLASYQLGRIEDPIFGTYSSSLFLEFDLNTGAAPDFNAATLDSAIVRLPFTGNNTYGNAIGQTLEVDFFEISIPLERRGYFSDEEIMTGPLLGTSSVTINSDSVEFYNPTINRFDTIVSHLRFELPAAIAQKIFDAQADVFENDTTLHNFFPGIAMRPTQNTNAMVGLNLGLDAQITPSIEMHYSNFSGDTLYSFINGLNSNRFTTFDHDFAGSIVADFVQDGEQGGDSLLFLQTLEGTNIRLEFENLEDLGDVIVNRTELVIPVEEIMSDDLEAFPPPDFLIVNSISNSGERQLAEDFDVFLVDGRITISDASTILGRYDEDKNAYRLNLSTHFQRMIDEEVSNVLEIVPFNNGEDETVLDPNISPLNRGNLTRRVVVAGPGQSDNPLRLEVFFTEIEE